MTAVRVRGLVVDGMNSPKAWVTEWVEFMKLGR